MPFNAIKEVTGVLTSIDVMQTFSREHISKEEKYVSLHAFASPFEAPDVVKDTSFELSFRTMDARDVIVPL